MPCYEERWVQPDHTCAAAFGTVPSRRLLFLDPDLDAPILLAPLRGVVSGRGLALAVATSRDASGRHAALRRQPLFHRGGAIL